LEQNEDGAVCYSAEEQKRSGIISFERKTFNAFVAMGPTGGIHYILTRNLIEKHFLFLFLRQKVTRDVLSALSSVFFESFIALHDTSC
jgi:hypothetical protein